MKTEEVNKAEEEKVQSIIESTLVELRRAFWKSRESLQVLQETGHMDIVDALKDAEDGISKALAVYERVL